MVDIEWDQEQLHEAGIDMHELYNAMRTFERAADRLAKLGLNLYMTPNEGCLVYGDTHSAHGTAHRENVVAFVQTELTMDGGDW